MTLHRVSRRQCLASLGLSGVTACFGPVRGGFSRETQQTQFRYLLGSSMYGTAALAEILPEVKRSGAVAVDLWPRPHGNQREQAAALGDDRFKELLLEHEVQMGCVSQFGLGPFGLQPEIRWASQFGCETIVTGAKGPVGLSGGELKAAVASFVESMKPHVEAAAAAKITIAIENHGKSLIESVDSIKWFFELRASRHLAIALAPYHLRQDEALISRLIRDVGPGIEVFYAWQYGKGCMEKLPKQEELLQMPGRGQLDFKPIVKALQSIQYSRWTEIFMHPVPRGIPILESTAEVTDEINRARNYLEASSR